MVILGLGSNLGDRLAYLRHAYRLLQQIPHFSIKRVSPVYMSDALMPPNAPPSWNRPYLNLALRCETTLSPYELLAKVKSIEIQVGRVPEKDWGPRVIDIDLLAWDDLVQYDEKLHIPHENLHERPFALWPLADVAPFWIYPLEGSLYGKTATEMVKPWGSRLDGQAPCHTRQIPQRIDTPQLVGIVNLTPDSFSDGGQFSNTQQAVDYIHGLVNAGADVIDIGAESTRPGAKGLTHEEEWHRLEPVLAAIELDSMLIPPKISIDTRLVDTARKALDFGIDWVNDVSGLSDPAMCELLAGTKNDLVLMHNLGTPAGLNHIALHEDAVGVIYRWCENKLISLDKLGIHSDRIIFDVGIGFGNTSEQALELIQRITEFQKLRTRLLVGHSRKSFLKLFTHKPSHERDIETLAISLLLTQQKVDFLRVHNVEMHQRAFRFHSVCK